MAWGRCDDGWWRHRKVAALEDSLRKPCVALFWNAISWTNDHLTDGRITMTGLRQIDGTREEADELVRVGLWDREGQHYLIHDFLKYNRSAEQVASDKAQRAAAGSRGAAARWGTDGDSPSDSLDGPSNGQLDGAIDEMDAPYPVSRIPVSRAPNAREWENIDQAAVDLMESLTGRTIYQAGQRNLTEYDRQIADHGWTKVESVYRKLAGSFDKAPMARQLIWSAMRVLEPFVTPQDIAKIEAKEREAEADRAHKARLEATQRRIRDLESKRGDAA